MSVGVGAGDAAGRAAVCADAHWLEAAIMQSSSALLSSASLVSLNLLVPLVEEVVSNH
jgi:hypothetical protein